jgi:protein-tyrosine phosphatase
MDITWVTERIGLGGGIWTSRNMEELTQAGVTHVINMQLEFDDRPLAGAYGVQVLWNPIDDDFLPKPPEIFRRGVDFALLALEDPKAKLYVNCAAGVPRAPMTTLAILCALEYEIEAAMDLVQTKRPVVDFADVYVDSVRLFLASGLQSEARSRD